MSKKLIIGIDATSWKEEMQREEPPIIKCEDDIVSLVVDAGYRTGQVAKFALAQRAMNLAPDDILKSDRSLLYAGGRAEVSTKVARRTREVEMENGKVFTVREFIGLPGRPDEDGADNGDGAHLDKEAIADLGEKPMVAFDTQQGLDRALHYLRNVVPGHIFERLKHITAAGGDVEAAAGELKATVDEMVGRLVD